MQEIGAQKMPQSMTVHLMLCEEKALRQRNK